MEQKTICKIKLLISLIIVLQNTTTFYVSQKGLHQVAFQEFSVKPLLD